MATPNDLVNLLNDIVKMPNEIDAILVFDSESGLKLYNNTEYDPAREGKFLVDNCEKIAASLSQLNIINHTLNEFGAASQRGELQYATFQLTSGVLNMYFFKVNQTSVAVGFISSTPEGLGLLLVHSKNNIDSIKNMLGDLL